MSYKKAEDRKKGDPLVPFIGFVLLVVIGGGAFLIAPEVVVWMANTNFTVATTGWQLLPFRFPETWPPILARLAVTVVLFGLVFSLAMIIMLALMKPASSELDARGYKPKRKRRR
jgi:hypothetical protein